VGGLVVGGEEANDSIAFDSVRVVGGVE